MPHSQRLLVLVSSLLAACTNPTTTGWATVSGVGVLGVHSTGEAYLCGTGDNVDQSRWLVGSKGTLTDDDGLWSLTIDDEGQATLEHSNGDSWTEALTEFEDGGVYDARPDTCRSGAVLYDGTLAGTFCDSSRTFFQVEPVDTFTGGPPFLDVRLVLEPTFTFTFERL
jgi:hypothetical protein